MSSTAGDGNAQFYIAGLVIFVIILFFGWSNSSSKLNEEVAKNEELSSEISELEDRVSELENKIDLANQNIDEANSIIDNAKGVAWSDYDSMGYALEDMSFVDNVSY